MQYIQAIGINKVRNMAVVYNIGGMGQYTKDTGPTRKQMERVDLYMLMVMCMKAAG